MTPGIVADLNPPRLPAEFIATGWPDLVAAFGVGLLLAALAAVLISPLLKPRPRRQRLAARLAELRSLPPEDRLLGQLRLLQTSGTPLPETMRRALYGRTPPDPEALEGLVRRGAPR
jgi:hypothetical protein